MSEFHIERGYREVYISDGDGGQSSTRSQSPSTTQHLFNTRGPASAGVPQYKMGPPTYRTGVYLERDSTRPPRPVPTLVRSMDPGNVSPHRSQITYHVQESSYQSSNRESPPPPPYSPPRHHARAASPRTYAVYRTEAATVPNAGEADTQYSPYQERKDIETMVPMYTASYPADNRYPAGAPSKIVYSAHVSPQGQVSSRASQPMGRPAAELSPGQRREPMVPQSQGLPSQEGAKSPQIQYRPFRSDQTGTSPRPYQLKPTMDSTGSPGVKGAGGGAKEAEVDALTDLLVQNMEVSGDPDFFGMCVKCGRAIMGDNQGCSALDQLFHKECFSCSTCGLGLKGYQFFAMEGKPYCEPCYLNTMEKCSVCSKVITDRILRATGKPYHPKCFMCVVCGKSLDGVQFTVDASNQIHCIEDFHKKFAPRCSVCDDPILPESGEVETVRLVAMDQSFHVKCYKCEDCGLLLSKESDGRGCYPLDNHILCKQCNAKRIQQMTTRMLTDL